MQLLNFNDLFVIELQDLYDAEQQILEAMPDMIEKTANTKLKNAFQQHFEETQKQVRSLEDLCEKINIEIEGKVCVGMEGIIDEGREVLEENEPSALLDAAMIGIAQKIEHYEIAGYGTAATYAEMLGFTDAKKVLGEILQEEKTTDEKLTKLAETIVNQEAKQTDKHIAM